MQRGTCPRGMTEGGTDRQDKRPWGSRRSRASPDGRCAGISSGVGDCRSLPAVFGSQEGREGTPGWFPVSGALLDTWSCLSKRPDGRLPLMLCVISTVAVRGMDGQRAGYATALKSQSLPCLPGVGNLGVIGTMQCHRGLSSGCGTGCVVLWCRAVCVPRLMHQHESALGVQSSQACLLRKRTHGGAPRQGLSCFGRANSKRDRRRPFNVSKVSEPLLGPGGLLLCPPCGSTSASDVGSRGLIRVSSSHDTAFLPRAAPDNGQLRP